MFTEKRKAEVPVAKKKADGDTIKGKDNAFIKAGMPKTKTAKKKTPAKRRVAGATITRSENDALKHTTTGSAFVDEFGTAGQFKAPRSYTDISKSMSTLWANSRVMCVKFLLYLRLITRTVQFSDNKKTEEVQRGQGLRHEGIFRMLWLAVNYPTTFWNNVHLFIAIGSWKDIIVMLQHDIVYNGWKDRKLEWDKMGKLILAGLENPNTTNLVKKYLPQIKANSVCKTVEAQADNTIAKWICSLLYKSKESPSHSYKMYRKLKTSGTAHEWQKLISQNKMLSIDFNTVHGRALSQLVSGKFLKNNHLEDKYAKWIATKPIAKYTGFVYELFKPITAGSVEKYQEATINSQFKGLVETAKKGAETATSFIPVVDTSASMSSTSTGCGMMAAAVAKSLALFFSEMLPDGTFAGHWIDFNYKAELHAWKGSTPVEKWKNARGSGCTSNTNFQTVIDLFCKIKANGVKEAEFPTGIICISDGEFDQSELNKTNTETAFKKLSTAGFSKGFVDKFKIVLWNVSRGQSNKFESNGDTKNVFYLSGLDGSVVSFITGMKVESKAPSTAEELFNAAMDQEVLNMVEV